MNHFQERRSAFGLADKTALVTGGASGIGAAVAQELSEAGADVIVADINLNAAEALAVSLPRAISVEMDVTSAESISRVVGRLNKLDILINNAGIGVGWRYSPHRIRRFFASHARQCRLCFFW